MLPDADVDEAVITVNVRELEVAKGLSSAKYTFWMDTWAVTGVAKSAAGRTAVS
jgi:hypothetical protein